MAIALGIDADTVLGKLIRVWSWFDTNCADGDARSVTVALLDRVAMHAGFGQAMELAGWLDVSDGGFAMPNFERHKGQNAKRRALTQRRMETHRASGDARSVTKASPDKSKSETIHTPKGVCPGPTPRTRKPDPIWDTVVAEWFAAIDPKKIPATTRTRIGKVVRDLKAFTDCTPAEIVKRRARMVQEFTDLGDTPESMAKHWAKFGPKAKAAPNIFDVEK